MGLKIIEVRRKGKRQRKASKKFVKLSESIKVRLDAKTVMTCRKSALSRWLESYPNLEIL